MTRVLIASPVRQNPAILAEFLMSLNELDTAGLDVEFAFVDDNENLRSSELLRTFKPGRPVRFLEPLPINDRYETGGTTHQWLPSLINRVASYKDRFIELVLKDGFDGVLLVDSDYVLHPRTLHQLIGNDVPICSEINWTKWWEGSDELPNVWLQDQYSLFHRERGEELTTEESNARVKAFLALLHEPGLHQVGGLGGLTLVRREAIERGASFRAIPNINVIGEDRDFCIRASTLGIPLYVDTHLPALHLYREEDLARVPAFKAGMSATVAPEWRKSSGNRIVLSMVVRNEAARYLKQVLEHAASYVDAAVIIDDASTDNTIAVCHEALKHIPHTIVPLTESLFAQEHLLRRTQWLHTLAANPDWVLSLDADDLFEDSIRGVIRSLVDQTEVDAIQFRLYDMWNETQYREDPYWQSHFWHRTFLIRPTPGMPDEWAKRDQHASRLPPAADQLRAWTCTIRLKHLGWMNPADRIRKAERYRVLDPNGAWGSQPQYDAILDKHPTLIDWNDEGTGRDSAAISTERWPRRRRNKPSR